MIQVLEKQQLYACVFYKWHLQLIDWKCFYSRRVVYIDNNIHINYFKIQIQKFKIQKSIIYTGVSIISAWCTLKNEVP